MNTLEQKCRILFQENQQMDMLLKEICRFLAVFLAEDVELHIGRDGDVLGGFASGDVKQFFMRALAAQGNQIFYNTNL